MSSQYARKCFLYQADRVPWWLVVLDKVHSSFCEYIFTSNKFSILWGFHSFSLWMFSCLKNTFPFPLFLHCCSQGHVGIILAYLLPKCPVIMIEINDESVRRALQRVNALQLTNASLYQSNIDYFHRAFDIGVSILSFSIQSVNQWSRLILVSCSIGIILILVRKTSCFNIFGC